MNKTIVTRKVSKALAVVGLLVAGGFAVATPASAATANCLMTANPAVSLTTELSSYEQRVRNANVDKCQVAQERAEATSSTTNSGNVNTAKADVEENDSVKVAM